MLKGTAGYQGADLEAKRIGHILGIEGGAKIKPSEMAQTYIAPTEGNYNDITSKYILEKLNQYTPPESQKVQWGKIRAMFTHTEREAQSMLSEPKSLPELAADQVKRYYASEPVFVASGWSGHHIGVTFYKGYMIVSNRGEHGDGNKGTIIYKLKRDIKPADLIELQQTIVSPGVSASAIQAKLAELQGAEVGSFPQKPQKYGTCSYVNKVAATEGLLCLLTLQGQKQLNDAAIKAYTENNTNRAAYKAFTDANRVSEVNRLVELINQAARGLGDKDQLAVMVNLAFSVAAKYLRKNDDPVKSKVEAERANRLLQVMMPHQNLLTSANKAKYASLKQDIENRVAVQQPLSFGNKPLTEDLKNTINQKISSSINIVDRLPRWYMELFNKVQAAKTFDEIVVAFDNASKKSPEDAKLRQLNVDVRAMLRAAVKLPERVQPTPPVRPSAPIKPVVAVDPAFESLKKEVLNCLPIFSLNDLIKLPAWYASLSIKLNDAKNIDDIITAFSAIKLRSPDKQFVEIMNKSFEVLIRKAKSIDDIIKIVSKYPSEKIVSPSGSAYEPKVVIAQLKQTPLTLTAITSALGIRDKVSELQRALKQDAPKRHNYTPLENELINKLINKQIVKNPEVDKIKGLIEDALKDPKNVKRPGSK